MSTTEDDSNRAAGPNPPGEHPILPGCGPGGRGFESRRSPLKKSLQSGTIGRSPESPETADGLQTGAKVSSELGSEGSSTEWRLITATHNLLELYRQA